MLKPLQPGIEPLGQFDFDDSDVALCTGGEVGIFQALDVTTDAYAADVFTSGPQLEISLDRVATAGDLFGLVDEGTTGYGTMFGTMIGTTTGKGTGMGALKTQGIVVIGPSTIRGPGKCGLWTKSGLYGVTESAWASSTQFEGGTVNTAVYGHSADGTLDGKLTTTASGNGQRVATFVGRVNDSSLVSTTSYAVSGIAQTEYAAIYLAGL